MSQRVPSHPWLRRSALLIWTLLCVPCWAQQGRLDLIEDMTRWSVNTDRPESQMTLADIGGSLAVEVVADGGQVDYPKARLQFSEPQDWQAYAWLRVRQRVACEDPSVRRKTIGLVFYDERRDQSQEHDRIAQTPLTCNNLEGKSHAEGAEVNHV